MARRGRDAPAPDPPAAADPHAHWAVPALERLRRMQPRNEREEDEQSPRGFGPSERVMPPMPDAREGPAAMRRWVELCTALRSMFGSGN